MAKGKQQKNQERIKNKRASGFTEGTFECECGFFGSTHKGGEGRHKKSKKCREFFERRNTTATTTHNTLVEEDIVPVTRPALETSVDNESEATLYSSRRKRRKSNT